MAERAQNRDGNRTLLTAHRKELVRQMSETLKDLGIAAGLVAQRSEHAWMEEHGIELKDSAKACVVVVSAGTYRRRIGSIGTFKLGLIDEAHHLGRTNGARS
jgi:superfamily II DNA or RNA helicase